MTARTIRTAANAPRFTAENGGHGDIDALPFLRSIATPKGDVHDLGKKPGQSPDLQGELSFIDGLTADGKITNQSYWGAVGQTAFKWGSATAGTGATITYSFDAASHFTATEKATFLKAFAMWESIGNVHFQEVRGNAGVVLERGNDGGAYTQTPTSNGSGSTLGQVTGQAHISIDTSVPGFDLSGSLSKYGGYGMATIIHEVGHLLGLGHGGAYNGDVDPKTDQYSAFDNRMYSIMSYISWVDSDAKYENQNPIQNTDWGTGKEGYYNTNSHTPMLLDIAAIQQLYGVSQDTPFDGHTTYGFNSTVDGALHDFFDFSVNTAPVVTLYNQGTDNTLDLSGYSMSNYVTLAQGGFSSVAGLTNNVFITFGTQIDTLICGRGNDLLLANDDGCTLIGGRGTDEIHGGAGADRFGFAAGDTGRTSSSADEIFGFSHAQHDLIDLSKIDAIGKSKGDDAFSFIGTGAFGHHAGELRVAASGSDLFVMGDTNGDGKADFMIHLDHASTLVQSDFVL